jgi:hypothetical protein
VRNRCSCCNARFRFPYRFALTWNYGPGGDVLCLRCWCWWYAISLAANRLGSQWKEAR